MIYDMISTSITPSLICKEGVIEVDNTLRDLQNSSNPTKAEFNNCLIIYSKYFHALKGELIKLLLTPLQL